MAKWTLPTGRTPMTDADIAALTRRLAGTAVDQKDKLEDLLAGAETVLEEWDRGDEAAFREAIEELRADVAAARGAES